MFFLPLPFTLLLFIQKPFYGRKRWFGIVWRQPLEVDLLKKCEGGLGCDLYLMVAGGLVLLQISLRRRERERTERERERGEGGRGRERESVCVCVCARACVFVC